MSADDDFCTADGVRYIAESVRDIADDDFYIADSVRYIADDDLYIADSVRYMADDDFYIAESVRYIARSVRNVAHGQKRSADVDNITGNPCVLFAKAY